VSSDTGLDHFIHPEMSLQYVSGNLAGRDQFGIQNEHLSLSNSKTMKGQKILSFVKTTIIGGIFFLVPIIVIIFVISKAFSQ